MQSHSQNRSTFFFLFFFYLYKKIKKFRRLRNAANETVSALLFSFLLFSSSFFVVGHSIIMDFVDLLSD